MVERLPVTVVVDCALVLVAVQAVRAPVTATAKAQALAKVGQIRVAAPASLAAAAADLAQQGLAAATV
jgi:hypothetical protein